MIGVTNEPRNLVDAYVSRNSPKYSIICEGRDSGTTFGLAGGYPTQYVIGADGRIAWAGNFFDQDANAEQILEKLLKDVRLTPELTPKLDAFKKLLEKHKFVEARAGLAKVAADDKADAADKKAAAATVQWIDDGADAALKSAADQAAAGDVGDAALAYDNVSTTYAGLDAATKAADALKALLADPAKKREIDAARALVKAQAQSVGLSAKKAIPLFKSIVTNFKGTKAAAKAEATIADLEKPAGK